MRSLLALWSRFAAFVSRGGFVAPLLCRLTLGYVFVESGWGKLHNLDKVAEFFAELGIPAPHLQAPFVAGTELLCGALVLVGLATRLASVPLLATMVVALATARKDDVSSLSDLLGTIEGLYAVLAITLFFTGGGLVSLDRALSKVLPAPARRGEAA